MSLASLFTRVPLEEQPQYLLARCREQLAATCTQLEETQEALHASQRAFEERTTDWQHAVRRADSLTETLAARDRTIEEQSSEISRLREQVAALVAVVDERTTLLNEAVQHGRSLDARIQELELEVKVVHDEAVEELEIRDWTIEDQSKRIYDLTADRDLLHSKALLQALGLGLMTAANRHVRFVLDEARSGAAATQVELEGRVAMLLEELAETKRSLGADMEALCESHGASVERIQAAHATAIAEQTAAHSSIVASLEDNIETIKAESERLRVDRDALAKRLAFAEVRDEEIREDLDQAQRAACRAPTWPF